MASFGNPEFFQIIKRGASLHQQNQEFPIVSHSYITKVIVPIVSMSHLLALSSTVPCSLPLSTTVPCLLHCPALSYVHYRYPPLSHACCIVQHCPMSTNTVLHYPTPAALSSIILKVKFAILHSRLYNYMSMHLYLVYKCLN